MNSFGRIFRISIFGESHGVGVGVVVDGVKPGIALCEQDFLADLKRRQGGSQKGTTPRVEADEPEIVSGVFEGHTTGAPLTVMFKNANTRSKDYSSLVKHPRPSHADMVALQKFDGFADYRGGGHFSGRLTLALVAAGVVAKKMLEGVAVAASLIEIDGCNNPEDFDSHIQSAMKAKDSVGGIIECTASGIKAGVGEPFFDSLESVVAHILFSVPAVKGVEFGLGFESARLRGSENNDVIIDSKGATATNNDGGINGGISNGNNMVVRVAIKPTPSIAAPQFTYNLEHGAVENLEIQGRHDACIALRAQVVVEAAVAVALADMCAISQK